MSVNYQYFGTNLKMYKTNRQTSEYLTQLAELTQNLDRGRCRLFVIPSFTALEEASALVNHNEIMIGAQNMHWAEEGQYTGEISPRMLSELNIDIVELGHSERRHDFGETNEFIAKKVDSALKHHFIALLCVGETEEEKSAGHADDILRQQLKLCLSPATAADVDHIWIAYEPTWSIGVGGTPASPNYIADRHRTIRDTLCAIFGSAGEDIPILYGGGVNLENAAEYIKLPNTNGLFVGRCAWDAARFRKLIDIVNDNE